MGSVVAPLNIRMSPFVTLHSGAPYDVLLGRDIYGDTLKNARPTFATPALHRADMHAARGFLHDPVPGVTHNLVPRNYLTGAGLISFNVRVARTFGFGAQRGPANALTPGDLGGPGADGGGRRGRGWVAAVVASAGWWRSPRRRWWRRHAHRRRRWTRRPGAADTTDHRYNVSLSVNVINLLNHYNPGGFQGVLNSPQFGHGHRSQFRFRRRRPRRGGGGGSTANNRRMEFHPLHFLSTRTRALPGQQRLQRSQPRLQRVTLALLPVSVFLYPELFANAVVLRIQVANALKQQQR